VCDRPALDTSRRHDLTPTEVECIVEHVPERYRAMVWLGAVVGLRWSEVIGLRVGRLDLARGTLTVAESITRGVGGRLVSGPPKSFAGNRTVSLPNSLATLLQVHLDRAELTAGDRDALVFTNTGAAPSATTTGGTGCGCRRSRWPAAREPDFTIFGGWLPPPR
jgi:integrase